MLTYRSGIFEWQKNLPIEDFHMFYIYIFIAEPPNIELVEGEDGELLISIPLSAAPEKLPQYYGFTTGRHSGSFFLKIGAAVFCVIHIIHLFLMIVKEVSICWKIIFLMKLHVINHILQDNVMLHIFYILGAYLTKY